MRMSFPSAPRVPRRPCCALVALQPCWRWLWLGGCVVYPAGRVAGSVGEVYVDVAPPAPLYEPVPVSPGIGFVWVPGVWNWGGARYVWIAGRWERPPHGYNHWRPGTWSRAHRGYRWTEGRWDNEQNLPRPPHPNLQPGNPRPPYWRYQ